MQISIKYLLTAVGICCIGAFAISNWLNDPETRIRNLGATIQLSKLGTGIHAQDVDDKSFERLVLEINRFGNADALFLSGSALTNSGLSEITNLRRVRYLFLDRLSIDSASLDNIAATNGLRYVYFTNCKNLKISDIESLREKNKNLEVNLD